MSRLINAGAFSLLMGVGCAVICVAADPPREENRPTSGPAKGREADDRPPVLRRYAWETAADYEVRRRLSRRMPRIEMKDVEFEEALRQVAALCDVDMAPHWAALDAAGISKDAEVTVAASNLCGDDLLGRILDEVSAGETELTFVVSRGCVEVSTEEDLRRAAITCTYDCADLLYADDEELARYVDRIVQALVKYGNVSLSYQPEAVDRLILAALRESREAMREELIQVVTWSVDPEYWRDAGGNIPMPVFVGTQMVVTQTKTAHMEIDELLESLRAGLKKPKPAAGQQKRT
jgi:hypothetical protein